MRWDEMRWAIFVRIGLRRGFWQFVLFPFNSRRAINRTSRTVPSFIDINWFILIAYFRLGGRKIAIRGREEWDLLSCYLSDLSGVIAFLFAWVLASKVPGAPARNILSRLDFRSPLDHFSHSVRKMLFWSYYFVESSVSSCGRDGQIGNHLASGKMRRGLFSMFDSEVLLFFFSLHSNHFYRLYILIIFLLSFYINTYWNGTEGESSRIQIHKQDTRFFSLFITDTWSGRPHETFPVCIKNVYKI